jgi:hypothetical protein
LLVDPWIIKNVPAASAPQADAGSKEPVADNPDKPKLGARRLASVRHIQQRQEIKKKNQAVKKFDEESK